MNTVRPTKYPYSTSPMLNFPNHPKFSRIPTDRDVNDVRRFYRDTDVLDIAIHNVWKSLPSFSEWVLEFYNNE